MLPSPARCQGGAAAQARRERADSLLPTQNVAVASDRAVVLPELEALAKSGAFGKDGIVILDADGRPAKAQSPRQGRRQWEPSLPAPSAASRPVKVGLRRARPRSGSSVFSLALLSVGCA